MINHQYRGVVALPPPCILTICFRLCFTVSSKLLFSCWWFLLITALLKAAVEFIVFVAWLISRGLSATVFPFSRKSLCALKMTSSYVAVVAFSVALDNLWFELHWEFRPEKRFWQPEAYSYPLNWRDSVSGYSSSIITCLLRTSFLRFRTICTSAEYQL